MNQDIESKVNQWLSDDFDSETRKEVALLKQNPKALEEAFYKNLEFGTGGLRGIMGVGTNRMNKYTVGLATHGFAVYIQNNFKHLETIKVAIAYDCRNNSAFFAETAAKIFSSFGFQVYLFDALRPTPELSFAIRELKCQAGIVITASHNPKEYNGFKAYWDDGAQLTSPHDTAVIDEVNKINIADVDFVGQPEKIIDLGSDFDELYLNRLQTVLLNRKAVEKQSDLKIVYTPIHGTGVHLVPTCLQKMGFKSIYTVAEQMEVDGNFPTVISPNPEEKEALKMALEKAQEIDAELIMATDPDSDRVGIAVKNLEGKYELLNGNQTAVLLVYYLLSQWQNAGLLKGKEYIVKTIVTTELLTQISKHFGVEQYDVLTGFKYIATIMRENEGKKTFIAGGEESYGYLAGSFVRDKDAVMSCAIIAEAAAYYKSQGKTLFEQLTDIYKTFGFYLESLVSVVKKGKEGNEAIQTMMQNFRNNPPQSINAQKVVQINDYQKSTSFFLTDNTQKTISLPQSNVLQFILEDESIISVRPSGTEPKIKFYIGVKADFKSDFKSAKEMAEQKIKAIRKELNLDEV